ncbi:MAG: anthranilate phosphoribosyltransferase [Nitrososphaerota archaeon]|nr:anthranilate phosphoribosyltransferase [Nitrososphaerota archaeon]MDG6939946.1 anthranilate phosphoribosyltransferase [Nitrososphaerota archaeon]
MIVDATKKAMGGGELTRDEVSACVSEMVDGGAAASQIGAFLTALRVKGETPGEIASFAAALRRMAVRISPAVEGRLVDTCGTGGDAVKTFNVSTVAAFVAAGAGVRVAKHGNRSVSSRCGSADLLERLGVNLAAGPERVRLAIENVGIGFIYAPSFHPALKSVGSIRRELGFRTVFNLLGPLLNPAEARAQLLGVYDGALTEQMAEALSELGSEEAMVVHGEDGLDEISVSGTTRISWLKDGRVSTRAYSPRELGSPSSYPLDELRVSSQDDAVRAAVGLLLGGGSEAKREMALVNAAAAIVLAGGAPDLPSGREMALESLKGGAAYRKLEELVTFTGGDRSVLEKVSAAGPP